MANGSIKNSRLFSYSEDLVIPMTPARFWHFFIPLSSAFYMEAGKKETTLDKAFDLNRGLCPMTFVILLLNSHNGLGMVVGEGYHSVLIVEIRN
jgi:hypothetical protein